MKNFLLQEKKYYGKKIIFRHYQENFFLVSNYFCGSSSNSYFFPFLQAGEVITVRAIKPRL